VRSIVARLIARPFHIQLAAHLLLCAVFCTLSYCLLIILLALFFGAGPSGFVIRPFSVSGTAWQSLQNVTTYALIAALVQVRALSNRQSEREWPLAASAIRAEYSAADLNPPAKPETISDAGLSRYFVKIGEELRPLDLDMVVSINGADDYAEVSTTTGKHLVRVRLASFAKSLDPSKYIRVHRSWIVNTCRVIRAEPAGGGRLLLHMETGQTISTSRDGARLFRDRVL
jgi:DNA-binding LytR/AlgR family response regulator